MGGVSSTGCVHGDQRFELREDKNAIVDWQYASGERLEDLVADCGLQDAARRTIGSALCSGYLPGGVQPIGRCIIQPEWTYEGTESIGIRSATVVGFNARSEVAYFTQEGGDANSDSDTEGCRAQENLGIGSSYVALSGAPPPQDVADVLSPEHTSAEWQPILSTDICLAVPRPALPAPSSISRILECRPSSLSAAMLIATHGGSSPSPVPQPLLDGRRHVSEKLPEPELEKNLAAAEEKDPECTPEAIDTVLDAPASAEGFARGPPSSAPLIAGSAYWGPEVESTLQQVFCALQAAEPGRIPEENPDDCRPPSASRLVSQVQGSQAVSVPHADAFWGVPEESLPDACRRHPAPNLLSGQTEHQQQQMSLPQLQAPRVQWRPPLPHQLREFEAQCAGPPPPTKPRMLSGLSVRSVGDTSFPRPESSLDGSSDASGSPCRRSARDVAGSPNRRAEGADIHSSGAGVEIGRPDAGQEADVSRDADVQDGPARRSQLDDAAQPVVQEEGIACFDV